MLRFKIKNIEIAMHFSFFAVIALLGLIQESSYMLLALIACMLHESGHILLMCLFSVPPKKIDFYGAGIKITPDNSKITSTVQDFLILSGGSVTNIILFAVIYPMTKSSLNFSLFAVFNLIIGLFNLIPFKHFDGGKIIDLFLVTKKPEKSIAIRKIIRYISVSLFVLFGVVLLLKKSSNISLYFTICFIIISELFL